MRQFFILVCLSIVGCGSPGGHDCDVLVSQVRKETIDSLKAIYEELKSTDVRPATITRPKLSPPTTLREAPGDTTFTDREGNTYPVHIGKNGGRYILRVSKKTGKEYKQYLK